MTYFPRHGPSSWISPPLNNAIILWIVQGLSISLGYSPHELIISGNTCSEVCITNFPGASQSKLIILSIADSSFGAIQTFRRKLLDRGYSTIGRVFSWHTRSPGFDLQHQLKLDLVVHAHDPGTYAVEAEGSKVQDSSWLCCEGQPEITWDLILQTTNILSSVDMNSVYWFLPQFNRIYSVPCKILFLRWCLSALEV